MKHYRAIDLKDTTRVLYIRVNDSIVSYEDTPERVVLEEAGYILSECSKEEYDRMSGDLDDYIINVGHDRKDLGPYESAFTGELAINRAIELCNEFDCVEVVYMPNDDDDINEIIWSHYEDN